MKYGMGDLVIDTGRQLVNRAGVPITLPKLSYELLLVLMRAAPDVVTIDQLMREVWPGLVVSPETVSKRVTLLRDALGDDSQAPRYIVTLRGRGYQVVADVAKESPSDVLAAPPTLEAANPSSVQAARRPFRNRAYLIVGAILLVSVAAQGWQYWARHQRSASAADMAQPAPGRSIAVLPFLDMSEAKDQEYFADGMTEAIIDLLTKIPELRVPARTSSFYFKGKATNVSDIGRELKVAHVLEGSVRKSGNRLRITAQLIRADNGYHVWSETYDRSPDDIFRVQDEIAAQVAAAMQLRLLDPAKARHQVTPNAEAYALLLQGRYLGRRNNQQDRERSIDLFRRAIEIDPSYALAWAWLSTGYTVQVLFGWSPPAVGYARAREAAQRAIDLEPDLADGHSALGHVFEVSDWNWAEAKKEYQAALTLDPRNVRVLNLIGHLAMDEGRVEDAIGHYRAATVSDPLSTGAQSGLAYSLWAGGHLAEAELVFTKLAALSQFDGPAALGLLMVERGEEGGLEEIDRDHYEPGQLVALSMANHRLARQSQSDQALDELKKKYPNLATKIAQTLAYRGEFDEAFQWAEKAYAAHDKDLTWIKVHVGLRDLPHDARLVALLRKMNLPE
jgi:adenylate cyclase